VTAEALAVPLHATLIAPVIKPLPYGRYACAAARGEAWSFV
jgi:hypothetical protein